jgi:hypothetical protein
MVQMSTGSGLEEPSHLPEHVVPRGLVAVRGWMVTTLVRVSRPPSCGREVRRKISAGDARAAGNSPPVRVTTSTDANS